jgi:hypothetical protein
LVLRRQRAEALRLKWASTIARQNGKVSVLSPLHHAFAAGISRQLAVR